MKRISLTESEREREKRERKIPLEENAYFDGEKEKSNEINEEAALQRKKYILVQ